MSFIDLIPKKIYAAAVAALLLVALALASTAVYLKLGLSAAQKEHAQLQAQVASVDQARERAAREAVQAQAKDQFRHSEIQQGNVNAYRQQENADRSRDRARDDELARLRDQVRAYAAGGAGARQADPGPGGSDRDRSERLGAALDEALQLQGEAESFIRQRDREVKLLKDTITNDRELTQ